MSTELAIRPDQTSFDAKQRAALTSLGVRDASDADVNLFFHQAARTGLDPFARQIYLINRGGKQTIQVGIDGFRLIRDRKGTYRGHTEEWCGDDMVWHDVWLGKTHPSAARVQVYVQGYTVPIVGIATWDEYAQLGRDNRPQSVWASKPALMLAKCAEALALRKAFPQDLSGLYTTDEIPEAEQDHDGVYVTTTMRSDSGRSGGHNRQTEAPQRDAGHAASHRETTPAPAQRPGRPRTDPVAGTADQTTPADPIKSHVADFRAKSAVADEWVDKIADIESERELYTLHDEAARRHVLDFPVTSTHDTVEARFLARRAEFQQAAAGEPEPVNADYDDEVPF